MTSLTHPRPTVQSLRGVDVDQLARTIVEGAALNVWFDPQTVLTILRFGENRYRDVYRDTGDIHTAVVASRAAKAAAVADYLREAQAEETPGEWSDDEVWTTTDPLDPTDYSVSDAPSEADRAFWARESNVTVVTLPALSGGAPDRRDDLPFVPTAADIEEAHRYHVLNDVRNLHGGCPWED